MKRLRKIVTKLFEIIRKAKSKENRKIKKEDREQTKNMDGQSEKSSFLASYYILY